MKQTLRKHLNTLPNQFRTNFKNLFIVRRFWKGPRNLLRKTCKGWVPIINPRSSFVDPSVLRFNARFTRGKSHWVEFISETNLPIAIHLHLCFFNVKVLVKSNSSECVSMGAVGAQTRRSLGHHLLHPLILRLLVLCVPAVLRPRALQDSNS